MPTPILPFPAQCRALSLASLLLVCGLLTGCGGCGGKNAPASPPGTPLKVAPDVYVKMVTAFYAGALAYETSGDLANQVKISQDHMEEATRLVPEEPAAWANLGLLRLWKLHKTDEAKQALDKALALCPAAGTGRSQVEALYGFLESSQPGRTAEALSHYRKAIELDSANLRARYALVEELKRQPGPESETESVAQLDAILQSNPNSLTILLERAMLASKRNEADLLRTLVPRIGERYMLWDTRVRSYYDQMKTAAQGNATTQVFSKVGILRNTLVRDSAYRNSREALTLDKAPLNRFIRLENPSPTPSAPDTGLTFTEQPLTEVGNGKWTQVRSLSLIPELREKEVREGLKKENPTTEAAAEQSAAVVVASDGKGRVFVHSPEQEQPASTAASENSGVRIVSSPELKPSFVINVPLPGSAGKTPSAPESVIFLDYDYNFRPDLVLAGAGGLKFLIQTGPHNSPTFQDITAKTGLPASVLNAAYYGGWVADYEGDGDLDLVLAPVKGAPFVFRNNGDNTWKVVPLFPDVTDLRGFAWADFDARGEPDAALLDAQGKLHLFENGRSGFFRPWTVPEKVGKTLAMAVADINRDGVFDLALLQADGTILRLSRSADNKSWETAEIARWEGARTDGTARLFWADLDNNGGPDLIATSATKSQIWLSDEKGDLKPLAAPITAHSLTVASTSDNGRLHLYGLSASGQAVRLTNRGTKNYHWQDVRPRATFVAITPGSRAIEGDRRINTFGLGGQMELRAGLLYGKQPIEGSTLHFGLGENSQTAGVRIIWPNGYVRSEFPDAENEQMKPDIAIIAPYRLGGSCPWLFAWNGQKMAFVTDCIWRSPLGLKINAQATAGVTQTEDWIKLRGDQLAPRNGTYDLSICAELWETHFFDHLALMTVDHPEGTEIFVDERFVPAAPPALAIHVTTPPQPVVKAIDDNGTDVTSIVNTRDGKHLDTFGRGPYQGVTRDHYVEVELPADPMPGKPRTLIATGWIHPTDSSINVAISQSHYPQPQGLSIEVPDGKGGWRVAKPGLGFPEGKIKTVVLDISDIFSSAGSQRLRLRTNLEIYWDYIGVANVLSDTPLQKRKLLPEQAELRYRGFSRPIQGDYSTPETADYDDIAGVTQSWLDLEGYYTRYGDVKPLLEKSDNRYVIMNAGDELALHFREVPPPPAGWKRDYVLIGAGWVKDGNFNTTHSRTVLPLPYNGQKAYEKQSLELEDDPVYRRFPQDWQTYHTRYVTPRAFLNAMRP